MPGIDDLIPRAEEIQQQASLFPGIFGGGESDPQRGNADQGQPE